MLLIFRPARFIVRGGVFFDYASQVTNYFNREDTVLSGSNIVNLRQRLGHYGAPQDLVDTGKIVDIDVTEHWHEIADGNDDGFCYDVPASHSFYRTDPTFARDVVETIQGNKDPRSIGSRRPIGETGRFHLK